MPEGHRQQPEHPAIIIWRASLAVSATLPGEYYALLGAAEREHAARFRHDRDRDRYIVSHGVMRRILSAQTGWPPHDLRFTAGEFGKPMLEGEELGERYPFSLSRSGMLMLLAAGSAGPVGVDIERIQSIDIYDLARTVCTARERDILHALPESRRRRYFFSLWARKESVLKACGAGLGISPAALDVSIQDDYQSSDRTLNPPASQGIAELPASGIGSGVWGFRDIGIGPEYAAAVAMAGHDWSMHLREWPEVTGRNTPPVPTDPSVLSTEYGG